MIVLDTNIISEMMKQSPALQVIQWIDLQAPASLFITAITVAEIQYGLHALPQGEKRFSLEKAFSTVLNTVFKYRILAFDETSAHVYREIMGRCKTIGKPMSILDGQIAAITKTHSMQLATRNISDFQYLDVTVLNPFEIT